MVQIYIPYIYHTIWHNRTDLCLQTLPIIHGRTPVTMQYKFVDDQNLGNLGSEIKTLEVN